MPLSKIDSDSLTAPLTVPAGSAAAPAITTTGDTNTGIFFPAADTIAFAEGGVEAARFDSAGNMGLGATPNAWGSNNRTIDMYGIGSFSSFSNGSGGYELDVGLNAYNSASGWRYRVSSYAVTLYQQAAGSHIWYNAAAGTAGNAITFTQAMTLDSSGNLLVGKTSTAYGAQGFSVAGNGHMQSECNVDWNLELAGSAGNRVRIFASSGITQVGAITASTTATTYATSSDYRLKEAITPMTGALAKVVALNPCTYKWKIDGSDGQGFIAHELDEVVPDCVTGVKDAVEEQEYEVTPAVKDEEGNTVTEAVMGTRTVPKYQGIDTSFLVATLTAAIQELKAIVDAQGAEIAALKGTP